MFSEMSFKCRSSSSLSSRTLVASFSSSTTNLLPTKPEKNVGLGIYAPKSSAPSFLAPRPSLSTIRSHATMTSLPPPSSPLPPLPAYFPEKDRKARGMLAAVHSAQLPLRSGRTRGKRTVHAVPPSPALSAANLAAFNRSRESMSSTYSRSISGESYSERSSARPDALSTYSRSFSLSSTSTLKKSQLSAMRRAADPGVVVAHKRLSMVASEASESDIDDAGALQAKLPNSKTVGEPEVIKLWETDWHAPRKSSHPSSRARDGRTSSVRHVLKPLTIRKIRDSACMVRDIGVKG